MRKILIQKIFRGRQFSHLKHYVVLTMTFAVAVSAVVWYRGGTQTADGSLCTVQAEKKASAVTATEQAAEKTSEAKTIKQAEKKASAAKTTEQAAEKTVAKTVKQAEKKASAAKATEQVAEKTVAKTIKQAEKKTAASETSVLQVGQFGYELLEQNLQETNPILSPVSAYVTLSMVGNGAKGATKKEFQKVLGSGMRSISQSLMETLPCSNDGTKLTIANSAWLDKNFTAKKKWMRSVKDQFHADIFQTDLATEATKDKINKWVSDRTGELIPKLLTDKLEDDTRLALLNALYFHADWQQQFVPESTWQSDFHLDNGKTKKADMMHATLHGCSYLKDDLSEGVILPYEDSPFAFVAVMPVGDRSIREWYQSYTPEKLTALIEGRQTKIVDLALPKFKARCSLRLNDSLEKMGLKKVFQEDKADLSLLGKSTEDRNLYLSFVLQEAVISVAEEGTEAAAATIGAVAAGSAMIMDKVSVNFDRPFLYMIQDMDSGIPVFMGIADQPD